MEVGAGRASTRHASARQRVRGDVGPSELGASRAGQTEEREKANEGRYAP